MKTKTVSFVMISSVVGAFAFYALGLLYLTWPISELSLNKSGLFGDSFGALTSLFSGLAFVGLIITIVLQKEELGYQRLELRENRKEFAKSTEVQKVNAQLGALIALLDELNSQISYSEANIANISSSSISGLRVKKEIVLKRLEAILIVYDSDLGEL